MSLFKDGNNILVSVVICSCNRKEYLATAIDSVLSQIRDFQIEVIIGDDCSIDGTRELLISYQKKYPDIIKLILNDKNRGPAPNWANAMKTVKGKYVAFCDDDDYWHDREKLNKQIGILENNREIGLVHTNYRILNRANHKFSDECIYNNESANILKELFYGKYKKNS